MVQVNFNIEFAVDMDEFNMSFAIPESFEKMIKELKEIKNEAWRDQILEKTYEWDEDIYKEFTEAFEEKISDFMKYEAAEIDFGQVIRSYFYEGEFNTEIQVYGELSTEIQNSMILDAYLAGADVPDNLIRQLASDKIKEIEKWAEDETLIVELGGVN